MNRTHLSAFFCAALSLCLNNCAHAPGTYPQTPVQAEGFRSSPPKAAQAAAFQAPIPKRITLRNGLTVYVLQREGLPLIHVRAVVRSGSSADPEALGGLANLTAAWVKAGTTQYNAQEVAAYFEDRGAPLSVHVAEDTTTFSATSMQQHFDAILHGIADTLRTPALRKSELVRIRGENLATYARSEDAPTQTANRLFRQAVFGKHPYGHTPLGTDTSLSNITPRDVVQYYRRHYTPRNMALIIVGNIGTDDAVAQAKKYFANWKKKHRPTGPPRAAQATAHPGLIFIDKAQAPQSEIRIGHVGSARNNRDYFAMLLCNAILGGSFNSRINMNLREDKGYTYGARSYFSFWRSPGPFTISTGVQTAATAASVREILHEVKKIRTQNVTDQELSNARNRYKRAIPGYFQTLSDMGQMLATLYTHDLPVTYYRELPSKLDQVRVADIRKAAQRHLKPDKFAIVIVGDPSTQSELTTVLTKRITHWDTAGKPL